MRVFAWRHILIVAVALTLSTNGNAHAGTTVYAVAGGSTNTSEFGTIDLATGQFVASATLPQFIASLTSGTDGTIFGGALDSHLYTIEGGGLTRFGSVGVFDAGLADSGGGGFFTYEVLLSGFVLLKVASDGNSVSIVGGRSLGDFFGAGTGNMAFGPDGNLYFVVTGNPVGGNPLLLRFNPASGSVAEIGTGLGTANNDGLALVTAGGQLYGIDNSVSSGSAPIGIYTIDTTTGVATATGVDVSGVPFGLNVNAAATIVPEPTSVTLLATSIAIGLGVLRGCARQRRAAIVK